MGNDCSLSSTEIDALETETAFSRDEIRDWYRIFKKGCPNGRMDKKQFRSMYEAVFRSGDAFQFVECVFHAYDSDGDGKIDFTEFLSSANISLRAGIDEKLRWLFKIYDLDGSGQVSKMEIIQMCSAILRMRGDISEVANVSNNAKQIADEIFHDLDLNGDKLLSEFEFICGAKSSPHILALLEQNQIPGLSE